MLQRVRVQTLKYPGMATWGPHLRKYPPARPNSRAFSCFDVDADVESQKVRRRSFVMPAGTHFYSIHTLACHILRLIVIQSQRNSGQCYLQM